MLVPSLALLYTLVLRGRLDTAAATEPALAAAGPGVAAGSARRAPAVRPARRRKALAALFAVATLVAGVGLLVFADPAWAHGVGAACLLGCAVTVFRLAAEPPNATPSRHRQ